MATSQSMKQARFLCLFFDKFFDISFNPTFNLAALRLAQAIFILMAHQGQPPKEKEEKESGKGKDKLDTDSDNSDSEKEVPKVCLRCKEKPVEFKCMPCGCPTVCKKCAMKMATGGKCKTCRQWFTEWKKVTS